MRHQAWVHPVNADLHTDPTFNLQVKPAPLGIIHFAFDKKHIDIGIVCRLVTTRCNCNSHAYGDTDANCPLKHSCC